MKSKGLILIFFLWAFLFSAQDSSSTKSIFYLGIEYGFPYELKNPFNFEAERGYRVTDYRIQLASYNYKSPTITLGYFLKGQGYAIKSDVGFWVGEKKMNYSEKYATDKIDGHPLGRDFIPVLNYYSVNESFNAKVDVYNIDWNIACGFPVYKSFSLFAGLRASHPIYYSVNGILSRNGNYYGYNPVTPTQLEPYQRNYYNGEIKNKNSQQLKSIVYLTLEAVYNFKGFLYSLQCAYPPLKFQKTAREGFVYFKIGVPLLYKKL